MPVIPVSLPVLDRKDVTSPPVYWLRDAAYPSLSVADVAALLGRGTPHRFCTLVTNVGELPPGYALEVGAQAPSRLTAATPIAMSADLSSATLAINVREAVRASVLRLAEAGGETLGLLLSGGLDSTILVCELVRLGLQPKCFVTVTPGRAGPKEHGYAERVCAELGLALTQVAVSVDDLRLAMAAMANHPRPVLCWVVASQFAAARMAARQGCSALAVGIGSDEIFGGYHKAGRFMWRFDAASKRSFPTAWEILLGPPKQMRRNLLFIGQCCPFSRSALRRLLPDADINSILEDDITDLYRETHEADAACDGALPIMEVELGLRVPDILVEELTVATRAAGLNLRFPFLDVEVTAVARTLPFHLKYAHDIADLLHHAPTTKACDKLILRAAFQDIIPAFVQTRPRATYTVPFGIWLQTELSLRDEIRDITLTSSVWDEVGASRSSLRKLFDDPIGNDSWGAPFRIWTVYQLAKWWESKGLHRWWKQAINLADRMEVKG